jgi:hypothetical protein
VCGESKCLQLGATKAADRKVARPASVRDARVRDDQGRMQACAGSKCRDLGPVVTRTARSSLARKHEPFVAPDLSVLVVYVTPEGEKDEPQSQHSQVFSISRDAELSLKPPASYQKEGVTPWLESVEPFAGVLLATWMSCASDDCVRSMVVSLDGENLGKELKQSTGVALDDGRLVVVGNGGDISVIDPKTGAVAAHATFDASGRKSDVNVLGLVALSAGEIAILWEGKGVQLVRATIGKQVKVGHRRTVPGCS